tara:strand:+ start:5211 stop:6056 length:846 start_codon:yes stop_codon:yes gene_type:complete
MEFKKDFKIKPKEVELDGSVIFTDGTNDVVPNQLACEAYGYKYDDKTGTCRSFVRNKRLDKVFDNETNKKQGENNKIQYNTRNTSITGRSNKVKGENNSCTISGTSNEIIIGIDNAVVFGKHGKATHNSEFCIGGGGYNSEAGLTQYSVLQVSGKTTSASDVDLYIEGDDVADTEITLPANSITTYEIWLSGLVTGGSSGNAGDYETYEYHGAIRCGNTGTLTHNAKISRLLGRTGSLGTQTIDTSTAYTLKIQIAGQNNVNCSWHAVVKLHTNKTNAATF